MSSLSCGNVLGTRRSRKRGREPEPDGDSRRNKRKELNSAEDNDSGGSKGRGQVGTAMANAPDTQKPVGKASVVMRNEVVMTKVAEKLPVRCLMSLRCTCTTWNRSFIPHVKKKHTWINVLRRSEQKQDTLDFISVIRSSREIPFTKYLIWTTSKDTLDYCMDFISEFGSTVKSLQLSYGPTQIPVGHLKKLIFSLTPQLTELELDNMGQTSTPEEEKELESLSLNLLPNLKQLSSCAEEITDDNTPAVDPAFTNLTSTVIQHSHHLECLDIYEDVIGNNFVGPILAGLLHNSDANIRMLNTLKLTAHTITNLQLFFQLARRTENSLRLTKLSIALYLEPGTDFAAASVIIRDILVTQSPTLKTICIKCGRNPAIDAAIVSIPMMEKLTTFELELLCFKSPPIEVQFEGQANSGLLLDTFPALRHFSFKSTGPTIMNSFAQLDSGHDHMTHPNVADLAVRVDQSDYLGFLTFGPHFHALTRLELTVTSWMTRIINLQVDGKEFGKIWTTWSALISVRIIWEVKVHVDLDLDSWITGVTRGRLERLKQQFESVQSANVTVTIESLRSLLEEHKTCASIIDLKHLQEFIIIFDGENKPGLTDLGGYFGIALAPSLQRVVIHGSLVTDQCRKFIRNTFGSWAEIAL